MSDMLTMTPEEVTDLITGALMRSRTSPENAASVARALLAAELAGQSGHGLRRVEAYSAQARAGKVDGFAVPSSESLRPGALAIDAANGFAYPAMDLALDWLPGAAKTQGIAIAGIRRSHHCGVAGVIVEALAERGVAALMVANAPAAMAPWGGRRPLFGTDPIAFAAPLPGSDPVVVDISLSKVARGKIMAAAQKGEPIPEGWALDPDGEPTTDAKAAMAGTMIPLGDAKGTALALMVELLCAGLTGANYAWQQTSFFDDKGDPPGTGQAIIAIDPDAFGPGGAERMAMMADMVAGTEGARLPGRRRQQIRADFLTNGIPVNADLMESIRAIGT
ncbi:MAG: Ldh family oxidoreductase [Hoeflea sp.]|uniref:Ldh family oxidoreductase n=1 Tax=Hoeflea sp. TaxID=1940281 RepID=UPI001D8DE083|nr:Ldh family oxidoreductase [Hoeflea sp.]MBU4528603.1 Ldh family oxidoreductase [Alphaproteobacteria bacterium]MBU4545592.1 Ldh family oxidoreductase [Alphaproteobacteria bacterium]MBU4552202.1 Ldh family oxidoreductase [Alphaproteobacteria bacterium]MBV1726206.1 Ldh family oxidoreductase [Hoeflea sp.]MBV1762367.1 Ldh family oxidoreductase [Hoeflea sp.]